MSEEKKPLVSNGLGTTVPDRGDGLAPGCDGIPALRQAEAVMRAMVDAHTKDCRDPHDPQTCCPACSMALSWLAEPADEAPVYAWGGNLGCARPGMVERPAPAAPSRSLPPEVEEAIFDYGNAALWQGSGPTAESVGAANDSLAALRESIAEALEYERLIVKRNSRLHEEQIAVGRKQLAASEARELEAREAVGGVLKVAMDLLDELGLDDTDLSPDEFQAVSRARSVIASGDRDKSSRLQEASAPSVNPRGNGSDAGCDGIRSREGKEE